MSGPEFFDPFGHGKLDAEDKPKEGKVFSLHGHPVTHPDEEVDIRANVNEFIDNVNKIGKPTRAIIILDGEDTGIQIRYCGDLDLGGVIGTLQIAAFVIMHETSDDG